MCRIIEELARTSGIGVEIVNAKASSGDGDVDLRFTVGAGGGASSNVHPFYINADGTLHAGTVSGTIPELGGDPIGEDGNTLDLSGDFYVYIRAEFSLSFDANFFLASRTLEALEIVTNATPLTDSQDTASLTTHRLIAQVIDGVVQRDQPTSSSLNLNVCDDSTGAEGGEAVQATWTTA